jgi:hypothetical protein
MLLLLEHSSYSTIITIVPNIAWEKPDNSISHV